MYNEQELIAAILNGNLNAFKRLVDQHEQLVASMIRRIIIDEEDIKDISQEVFLKVYRNISRFKFESKLSTWVAKIAYITALQHLRKKGSKRNEILDITDFENEYNTYENPENLLIKRNVSTYIHKHVSKLPLAYRIVVTLYHLNELSYREISDLTGMPEGTVKSYLFRARKLLKEKLKYYFK